MCNSITMKLVNRPARGLLFLLLAVRAAIVLVAVGILWLMLFAFFLPFLLLSELLGWPKKDGSLERETAPLHPLENASDAQFIFDRRKDISKLFGCNTRNVQYRWRVFSGHLEELKQTSSELRALDFGAGSLRDSYELARYGFRVVSMDLDAKVMRQYFDSYDWTTLRSTPELFADSIDHLAEAVGPDYFHLAISFDVIEHLESPRDYLQRLRPLLRPGGYLFAIVPNRRSLYERYFKRSLKKQREKGLPLTPGVPHLQFRSPEEWDEFIEENGFEIVEHDMAIGTFVNDFWNGALGLPIYVYVTPILQVLLPRLSAGSDPAIIERLVAPVWLMRRIDVFDNLFKKWLHGQFGWNIIVARKKAVAEPAASPS
ncbi:MAG: tRNA 5-carboxymethoxyuridine methyltransferase [Blastocatellia bacterium]|nr:tRNA 5-carboxymethoxyuridine methyltransferase [Blastocatellia bacterium]